MIFSVVWAGAGVGLPVPGMMVVYLVQAEAAGSFLPSVSVRGTPRRLLVFLAGIDGEMLDTGGRIQGNCDESLCKESTEDECIHLWEGMGGKGEQWDLMEGEQLIR